MKYSHHISSEVASLSLSHLVEIGDFLKFYVIFSVLLLRKWNFLVILSHKWVAKNNFQRHCIIVFGETDKRNFS